jgi:hypothetical protein
MGDGLWSCARWGGHGSRPSKCGCLNPRVGIRAVARFQPIPPTLDGEAQSISSSQHVVLNERGCLLERQTDRSAGGLPNENERSFGFVRVRSVKQACLATFLAKSAFLHRTVRTILPPFRRDSDRSDRSVKQACLATFLAKSREIMLRGLSHRRPKQVRFRCRSGPCSPARSWPD